MNNSYTRYHIELWIEQDITLAILNLVAPYGLPGNSAQWFMCWFWHYIKCLFVCLLNFLPHFFLMLFRSTSPSRPNKVSLKCPSARPYVCPYVRPSAKSFFDFSEIWYVGRGRWVMHDGMQYDPIQGQGQLGHSTNSLSGPDFWFLSNFFVSRDFEVVSK